VILRWKIWYTDGSTFSSGDGSVFDAPGIGCQAIVQDHYDTGAEIVTGGDFFVWDDRGVGFRWLAVDIVGLTLYFMKPQQQRILVGEMLPEPVYSKIVAEARSAYDKNGWLPGERRLETDIRN
jgi:hypothetical protein